MRKRYIGGPRSSSLIKSCFETKKILTRNSATNWVETVLTHNLGEAYRWNTYDTDEGGWTYLDKNTATTSADTAILC